MFDRISDSFSGALHKLSGSGTISESNVREAMDEVRNALLEADVQYEVAEDFCAKVLKDALGQQVTKSVKPGQEMIAIVHRRLVELFGGDRRRRFGCRCLGLEFEFRRRVRHRLFFHRGRGGGRRVFRDRFFRFGFGFRFVGGLGCELGLESQPRRGGLCPRLCRSGLFLGRRRFGSDGLFRFRRRFLIQTRFQPQAGCLG